MATRLEAAAGVVAALLSGLGCSRTPTAEPAVRVIKEASHDSSLPLKEMPRVPHATGPYSDEDEDAERPLGKRIGFVRDPGLRFSGDPVRQLSMPALVAAPFSFSFDGIGQGFSGPQGDFIVDGTPSDGTADVGPTAIVETVSGWLSVFDRSGAVQAGPIPFAQLFSGVNGCGAFLMDPVVRYDVLAGRWVIAAMSRGAFCIAVSQTSDPSGSYNRYVLLFGSAMPDFPKLAVWPDAYYVTFNLAPTQVCALDRSKMLVGAAMTAQCAQFVGFAYPSDLDGKALPPPGTPNYLFNGGGGMTFHVDWTDASKSALTAWPPLKFAPRDNVGASAVPQPGTTQVLDPGYRVTNESYRFVYRRFADHEALLASENTPVVDPLYYPGGRDAIRWTEFRLWHGAPYIYQQGTYAPDDGVQRFYPSAAFDQSGNIGMGFNVGSKSLKPGLRFTGRLANDELGLMTQGEGSFVEGTGVQTAYSGQMPNDRWGDYSMMAIDPVDDCTFWYTGQYVAIDGQTSWRTRIGSFKLPGCGAPPPADDFSVSVTPEVQAFKAGTSVVYTVNTAVAAGAPGTIALAAGNLPEGVSASFDPPAVAAGSSSKLTLTAAPDAKGSLPTVFSAHGRANGVLHSAPASIQVIRNEFALSLSPRSQDIPPGGKVQYLIQTSVISGIPETISLDPGIGLAEGFSASIEPASITTGQNATYTLTASPTVRLGQTTDLAVWATAASDRHSAGATATAALLQPNDFAVQVDPASSTVAPGQSARLTVTTRVTNGRAESIVLTVGGLAPGLSAAVSRNPLTAGEPATITIDAAATAAPGPSQVTVDAVSPSASHRVTLALEVRPGSDSSPVKGAEQVPPKGHGCTSASTDAGWLLGLSLAVALRRQRLRRNEGLATSRSRAAGA